MSSRKKMDIQDQYLDIQDRIYFKSGRPYT